MSTLPNPSIEMAKSLPAVSWTSFTLMPLVSSTDLITMASEGPFAVYTKTQSVFLSAAIVIFSCCKHPQVEFDLRCVLSSPLQAVLWLHSPEDYQASHPAHII
jgi:hypothetical protein